MAKFEFPRNPGTQRESPFEDERGDNPFSDGSPTPGERIAENIFAAPGDSKERPYSPAGDYEAALVPNSKGALLLAIIGLVMSGLGVVGTAIGIAGAGAWITPLFIALPVQFAALATAVPACIIARRDLRAMKAGAMQPEGRGKSRLALGLGAFGILLSATPVLIYFGLLIYFALL